MTQTKGFFPLFSLSDQCAGRGKRCISQGKFSCISLNFSDLPPLLSSSAILVLPAKIGLGQTERRLCSWSSRYTEQRGSLGAPPDSAFTAESTSEPAPGWPRMQPCHQCSHWKPCWCESGWGKEGSSLDNQCTRICHPGHSSGGCEASSLMAFVESSLYYLLTGMSSTKLLFNTGQSESSEIFGFLWSWENKECVLSC